MQIVRDILEAKGPRVLTIAPEVPVKVAVDTLNRHRIGALPVVEERGVLLGIVTRRDILVHVVARGLDPSAICAGKIMTTSLETVSPETPVERAMMLMLETNHHHLPVTSKGKLCGIVSMTDVNGWLIRDRDLQITDLLYYITHG